MQETPMNFDSYIDYRQYIEFPKNSQNPNPVERLEGIWIS
jgi:hypothetical protein